MMAEYPTTLAAASQAIIRRQATIRGSSRGLSVLQDGNILCHIPSHEEDTATRFLRSLLAVYAVDVLAVAQMIYQPTQVELSGHPWRLTPMRSVQQYTVPQAVAERVSTLHQHGITFDGFIWAEELPPSAAHSTNGADGEARGSAGPSSHAFSAILNPDTLALAGALMVLPIAVLLAPFALLLDPMVIGLVRTGRDRGVWCVLGRWNH